MGYLTEEEGAILLVDCLEVLRPEDEAAIAENEATLL
jgi:hypothetical protein